MRYTIIDRGEQGEYSAIVSIEQGNDWQGHSTIIKPFFAEVRRGRERLILDVNTLRLVTPHQYDVTIERGSTTLPFWLMATASRACEWYRTNDAEFGLGAALVRVDSNRKKVTIRIPHEAEVIQDEEVLSTTHEDKGGTQ